MKKFKITCLLILGAFSLEAQEVLTVEKAIEIAVEKNYDLRIARNNVKISKVEKSTLNSGFLPTVSASSGINYSDETQNVTFADGTLTSVNNAITESYNASLTAEYTIFDGFERKFSNLKNQANFDLKKLQERQQIENTIVSIYSTYYDVAYQNQVVKNLEVNIKNSKDRLQRAQKNLKYGQGTKLDELNAQVDLNNDSISYVSSINNLKSMKRKFNLLLGRNVEQFFEVDTLVAFSKPFVKEVVLADAEEQNITSLLTKQNILLSELDIDINKAKFLPKVSGSAGYQWSESKNPPTSFALNNNAYGVNLGINLTWNLFDGGKSKTRIKTAKITKDNREIELYKAKEELKSDVLNAYDDYENKIFTMSAEEKNVLTNKLNFSRAGKQYNLSQITAIAYRQAQINLFNALNNYAKSKYDVKIAEINLKQYSGKLLE